MNLDSPILRRLREFESAKQTGSLEIEGRDSTWTVQLRSGLIEAIEGGKASDRLGTLLTRDNLLTDRDLTKLLKKVTQTTSLGDLILAKKSVKPGILKRVLRRQWRSRLSEILSETDAKVGNLRPSEGTRRLRFRCSLNTLILEMARRKAGKRLTPPEVVGLRPNRAEELEAWPWKPEEVAVASALKNQPKSAETLATELGRLTEQILPVLNTFSELGFIEIARRPNGTNYARFSSNGLGVVPAALARLSSRLPIEGDDRAFIQEQFRTLKVRLKTQSNHQRPEILTISSAFVQEGKSLVSTTLALAAADDPDRRVLLVDCDLRRPSIHKYLGISRGPGLGDYMLQEGFDPHCFMRKIGALFVLTAGAYLSNPVEQLSSKKMVKLMAYLREKFDSIVIDSPPLEAVSDARVLTELSDALVMVVRSGKTRYASAQRALRDIDRNKLLGVILNDVKPMMFNTYYNKDYYYSEGHGYYSSVVEDDDDE